MEIKTKITLKIGEIKINRIIKYGMLRIEKNVKYLINSIMRRKRKNKNLSLLTYI